MAPRWLRVSPSCRIDLSEVVVRASRSGGPGGQHANTSDTAVEASFDVAASRSLGPRQRARLLDRLGPVVRARAADTRSQARNREVALERLDEARNALQPGQQSELFSAIRGESRRGAYSARFTRFLSKDAVSWRVWRNVASAAERSFDGDCVSSREERGTPGAPDKILSTLLYALLRVRESNFQPSRTVFIYGGVQRSLETVCAPDPKLGDKLRQRGVVTRAESVVHMAGTTRNLQTGARTRFSVWWDRDSPSFLPVRIELEPRSFLRLAFEADREPPEQGASKS